MTLYTVAELAEMLEVSEGTLARYLRAGVLQGRKMGRRWYVSDQNLHDYFTASAQEGDAPSPGVQDQQPVVAGEPPPASGGAAAGQVQGPEPDWRAEVERLHREAERLKQEAERLEKLYGEATDSTRTTE
ncbi:MAG TPA: DNA-binding protein [Chloroflexi bacterium]|nr:DNA-binding protein [Chloroflexota bacterium]